MFCGGTTRARGPGCFAGCHGRGCVVPIHPYSHLQSLHLGLFDLVLILHFLILCFDAGLLLQIASELSDRDHVGVLLVDVHELGHVLDGVSGSIVCRVCQWHVGDFGGVCMLHVDELFLSHRVG